MEPVISFGKKSLKRKLGSAGKGVEGGRSSTRGGTFDKIAQIASGLAPSFDKVWTKFGPSLDQVWTKFGPSVD